MLLVTGFFRISLICTLYVYTLYTHLRIWSYFLCKGKWMENRGRITKMQDTCKIFSYSLHKIFHERFSKTARSMFSDFSFLSWFLSLYSSLLYFLSLRFYFWETKWWASLLHWYSISSALQTHIEALTFVSLSVGFFIQLSECWRDTRSLNQDGLREQFVSTHKPISFSLGCDPNLIVLSVYCVLDICT